MIAKSQSTFFSTYLSALEVRNELSTIDWNLTTRLQQQMEQFAYLLQTEMNAINATTAAYNKCVEEEELQKICEYKVSDETCLTCVNGIKMSFFVSSAI